MTSGSGPLTAPVQRLLAWYHQNARDLPWRKTQDPYHITVAEFLLHQTRVPTALPYYERFVQLFPDWETLASAPVDDVLRVWAGLGYYARARNLHALARRVCSQYGGHLPDSLPRLLELPGIGRYTAGAILSMVFRQDQPAVDGNARRVLCRLLEINADPASREGGRRLEEAVRTLLPAGRAAEFNQALMDLGSTLCTPRRPDCQACPLKESCRAQHLGLQESLPVRRPRRPLPHHDIAAGVIWRDGRILIAKRPPRGLLGGLWEFPGGKREEGERLEECLLREVREELGIEVQVGRLLTTARHAYTHFRITLHAYQCDYLSGEPQAIGCAAWKWVAPAELAQHAFPAANRAILAALQSQA